MRSIAVGLLLLGAAAWVGCGGEERGAPVGRAQVPEVAADAASPLARAFDAWRTQRPQHLSLSITHVVQPWERLWTGDIEEWSRTTARVARPLEAEAWVGKEDQAVIAPGNEQQLAFHRSSGAPLLQIGPPPGQSRPTLVWPHSPTKLREAMPRLDEASLGWSADRMPYAHMLGNDLTRLLDLQALADWLQAVPTWSTALADGGAQHRGKARAPDGDRTWGAVRDLDVTLVLDHEGRLLKLTLDVRRESVIFTKSRSHDGLDHRFVLPSPLRGDAGSWAQPFPLAQLRPPEELVETSVPKGYVVTDAAHERTVYVLRPAPGPVSPELEAFLRARRVVR